jgi:hypothetical protein
MHKNGPRPATGSQLPQLQLNDSPHSIAIDAVGNLYVLGVRATLSYARNGALRWETAGGTAMAVDALGNSYVGRYYEFTVPGHAYYAFGFEVTAYDASGNQRWYFDDGANSMAVTPEWLRFARAMGIAVDAEGNVSVAGYVADRIEVQKRDSNGRELWRGSFKDPAADFNQPCAVATDNLGNVYVTGVGQYTYLMPYTHLDFVTLKYDNAGNLQWAGRYGSPDHDDVPDAICVDSSANVYVTGRSHGTGTGYDYATVKYDPSGNQLWAARYDGPANGDDEARSMVLDGAANICVTGQSAGIGTSGDYATIKYDTDGNQLWVQRYDGLGSADDSANALALDPSGDIYVTGGSCTSGGLSDYATIKYDTDGNQLWVQRYHAPQTGDDVATAIALDANGSVFVSGGTSDWENYISLRYVEAGTTQPPGQPSTVSPEDGAEGLSLIPVLQSSDFSDYDLNDGHSASQWQVTDARGDYSSPVFDSGTDSSNLVRISIPSGRLHYLTAYCWRVRYQDSQGIWSDWSPEASFVTASESVRTGVALWLWIMVGAATLLLMGVSAWFLRRRLTALPR